MRLIFANDFVVRFDRADAVQSATIAANGWECSELVNGDMSCALGPLPQLDLCHRPSRARTGRAAPPQLRGAGINKGIHSFGLSAAVGELTCLAATVLWLPALLAYMQARRARKA